MPVTAQRALGAVIDGEVDLAFARTPAHRDDLVSLPLWLEETVVVFGLDHPFASTEGAEVLETADLDGEVVLVPADDVVAWEPDPGRRTGGVAPDTQHAVGLVAAGAGVVVLPLALARLHQRRDVAFRLLDGAPRSGIVLTWLRDADTDPGVEDFIGVVRGRTVGSTRGVSG